MLSQENYIHATQPLQGDSSHLFTSFIKPHRPTTTPTVAQWLKEVIHEAGIGTSIFKTHSTRAASTSAAANSGISTNEILKVADWSTSSTFQHFYYKPTHVLSTTNNTIDVRDWAFWNIIIKEWLTTRSSWMLFWTIYMYEEGEVENINGPTHLRLVIIMFYTHKLVIKGRSENTSLSFYTRSDSTQRWNLCTIITTNYY